MTKLYKVNGKEVNASNLGEAMFFVSWMSNEKEVVLHFPDGYKDHARLHAVVTLDSRYTHLEDAVHDAVSYIVESDVLWIARTPCGMWLSTSEL